MRAAAAGLLYFAIVFAAGAMLGAARMFVVEPGLGAMAAVLIELPLMVAVSWCICRWLFARLAFILLMVAELALTLFALEGTVASHLAAYRTPAALVGLAGQLAFAVMPLAVRRSSGRRVGGEGVTLADLGRDHGGQERIGVPAQRFDRAGRAVDIQNRLDHANTAPLNEDGPDSAPSRSGTTSRSCSHQKTASTA